MTAALKGNLTRLSLLPAQNRIQVADRLDPALVYCGGECADRMETTFPIREGRRDGQDASSTNRLFAARFGMCRNKLGGFVGGIDPEFFPSFR